jgi:hypothetical protein
MIRYVHLDPDLEFFTHPGSRGQKGTGSLIRIRNTGQEIYNSGVETHPRLPFNINICFKNDSAKERLKHLTQV